MSRLTSFTFGTTLPGSLDEVRPRVEAALKAEGFGVLTEIDVKATMKAKLGIDRTPMVILGACNPRLANAALDADPSVGALLPCNVVLREEEGGTLVEVIDPLQMLGIVKRSDVESVAVEAHERLERMVASLAAD
jgi:uncharacterized protein (DUF302 family)